jgi:lipopolysaccharide export system protein LptA
MPGNRLKPTLALSPMNNRFGLLIAALTLVLWTVQVPSVAAQGLADTFTGFSTSSDQPIDIEADNLEVDDAVNTAIFRGNVKVTQGEMILVTAVLTVTYTEGEDGGNQEISRMEASGSVVVNSAGNSVTGDWASFEMATRIIVFGGNVVVSQGENVLRGDRLLVNLNTNTTQLESYSRDVRVQGSFVPKQADEGAASGPAPETSQTN